MSVENDIVTQQFELVQLIFVLRNKKGPSLQRSLSFDLLKSRPYLGEPLVPYTALAHEYPLPEGSVGKTARDIRVFTEDSSLAL
jgi:hypothetical protein